MGNSYIGRQPIVDARGNLFAYDLLYPSKRTARNEYVTSSLINNLHNVFGIDKILGKRIGFIRVDHLFILSGMIHILPKERIVYALLEDSLINEELCSKLEKYSSQGYRFAVNDFAYTPENMEKFSPLFPYIEFLKIDAIRSGRMKREDANLLQQQGLTLIGSKIESHDAHTVCLGKGFSYFEGFFISKPRTLENTTFSVEQHSILRLWNMFQCDASVDELVKEFEHNHLLSLKLIRFINSAAFSLRNPVSSIRHVVTLLGREPLMRWLMLMLFSEAQESEQNTVPLLLMVVNRTELMSKLLELVHPNPSKEEMARAYFVGLLSLIHLLFNMPHREILRKLNVDASVERALFEGEGFYGELLVAVRAIEMPDAEGIENFLEKNRLEYSMLEPVIAETMEKVNLFDEAMG